MKLIPKNWARFQHYKHRRPPWIRLYADLLNDRVFSSLPVASKALAPQLWLLAAETADGSFDASREELIFRLRCPASEIDDGLPALISKGLFLDASTPLATCGHDASAMLAGCVQHATTETETETETEKNPLTPLAGGRTPKPSKPQGKFPEAIDTPAFRDTWQKWLKFRTEKRKSLTPSTAFAQLEALERVGVTLAIETIETSIRNGWQGLFPEKQSQQSQATRSGRQAMTYATAEDFNTPKDERGLPLSLGLSGPIEPVENADSEPFDY